MSSSERTAPLDQTASAGPRGLGSVRTVVRALAALVHGISLVGLVLSAVCLLAMLGYTAASVIGRYTGWWVILGADEIGAYAMAGCFFFGLAYVFKAGAFIAVSPFRKRIPARIVPSLEVAQLSIALVYVLVLLKYAWEDTHLAYQFDVTSVGVLAWRMWIPMATMPLGIGALALQIGSLILERIFLGRPAPTTGGEHAPDEGILE
jgi:TRAP-type C4-dicarboxylate transport system permease small subunit